MQRLAEGLVAGALPAVTSLYVGGLHVGEAGALALAAALDRGALPRLKDLWLTNAAIRSATRRWWPSRRHCGGGPRWSLSISMLTRSATRASPPSWRRRRLQVRRRCRLEG